MTDIAHPHDHFVKALLSDPEKAGTFLRERLPEKMAALLLPEPPELVPGSFVDKALREHLADRLFKAKTVSGRAALLYVLIDHKSSPDRKVGWQFQKYMTRAMEQWVLENPKWKRLPAILPFLFYHGAAEWKVPDEFLALVDTEEGWRPYLLNFRYTIFDLGKIPDRELSRHPKLRAWLLVAKYATRDNRQLEVKEFLVEALADAEEDFFVIVRYMVETYQRFGEETFREIIRRVRPEEEATMMSLYAQEIIAKGKPEWFRQGELKGGATLLLLQLEEKFGEISGLIRDKVLSADRETLEKWSLRVLKSDTLDGIFDV